jgi:hypothetical protein
MYTRATASTACALVALALFGTLASAAVDVDLSDFDDDVMRNMDDTVKSLDSHLAMGDAQSARIDAQTIREGLHWAEDYFTRKGNVQRAVQFAKQAEDLASEVAKAAAASDLEAAQKTYDSLVRSCRACHDVYKPPDS